MLAFTILSSHFHLILRAGPDVVANWDEHRKIHCVPSERIYHLAPIPRVAPWAGMRCPVGAIRSG
jgi:hypothetical protein